MPASTSDIKVLFFGDVVGKNARHAVAQKIAALKSSDFIPDVIIANAENLAHGKGITKDTVDELFSAGVDILTSGNHVFDKDGAAELLNDAQRNIIRPLNYPPHTPGRGHLLYTIGARQLLVVNAIGRVGFHQSFDDPFRAMDALIAQYAHTNLAGIIVDWHAEVTSEKRAMGFYLDGRVSAVLGTHTHVPTADAQVLPGGTLYVSDVGMIGAKDSMLGAKKEPMMQRLITQLPAAYELDENEQVECNSIHFSINPSTHKITSLTHSCETLTVG